MRLLFNSAKAALLLVAMALASACLAQAYPTKPVKLLVPFPPGGSTTAAARLIAEKLTERWGQAVIVDSRPGANGVIASSELLRSRPDGYTMLFDVNQHTINPFVIRNIPYDTAKDFIPVATTHRFELLLVANPALKANNIRELISLAKASPGRITYATADNGGLTHLASESFALAAGIKLQQVPYKGTAPALMDVLGGQVLLYFSSPTAAQAYVSSGKLKALAWTGKTRSANFPTVPTFAEAGLPELDASSWGGIFFPAGTPAEVVQKVSADIAAVLATPEVKEKMAGMTLDPFVSSPAQFSALIKSDLAKYARVVRETNLKVE